MDRTGPPRLDVASMPKPKILVIEDERSLVEVLTLQPGARRIRGARRLRRPGGAPAGPVEAARPGRAGPDAAEQARPGGLPRAAHGAADARDPDHHGHGQGRGDRRAGRVRDRRRRLRDQAVQHEGPDPADQEGAAAPAVEGRAGGRQGDREPGDRDRPAQPSRVVSRPGAAADPDRVPAAGGPASGRPGGRSRDTS